MLEVTPWHPETARAQVTHSMILELPRGTLFSHLPFSLSPAEPAGHWMRSAALLCTALPARDSTLGTLS